LFKTEIKWEKEIERIKELGLQGWGLTKIANDYGVSKQRISQITKKYIPSWQKEYGQAAVRKLKEKQWQDRWGKKENTDLYNVQRLKFRTKKSSALKIGFSWDIEFGDINWPTHCPILNLELDYFAETVQENSPSFDRIDSNKGYEKNNVHIISWRANRIKNDGTSEEHRRIADYLDSM
jgi:hypothetical protein